MTIDNRALLARARDEFARGRAARSRELCADVLASDPDDPEGLHLLAILELAAGNAPAALEPIERALRHDAGDAKKHQTHGLALRARARRNEAAAAFRQALHLSPEFPEAHASLALTLMDRGDFADAARHLERALEARAGAYPWQLNLGLCRLRLGEKSGAVESFERAVKLDPSAPEAHNNLGGALLALERLAEAEAAFRRCIALAPAHSHAWNNLGNVARLAGRAREAGDAYRRATQSEPLLAIAWVNLGITLKDADHIDEAMGCFARAEALAPALPEAHLSRAIACLLAGELDRGWEEYRWRPGGDANDELRERLREAIRAGQPIEVLGEQGLGDALFFLRWAAALREGGAKLVFRGDARLFPLLERGGDFHHFVGDGAGEEVESFAIACGDLPWAMHAVAPAYPPALALKATQATLEAARRLLEGAGPPPYVGIAWRAGLPSTGFEHRLQKVVPLEALGAALRQVPGTIVSLQRGPQAEELVALSGLVARRVLDAEALNADLDAMLGLLACLDEYVGVSSTNVHLRAGLGAAARVLVPAPPEWRAGRSGPGTPWFPAFRLYREERERGWAGALEALRADLLGAHGER